MNWVEWRTIPAIEREGQERSGFDSSRDDERAAAAPAPVEPRDDQRAGDGEERCLGDDRGHAGRADVALCDEDRQPDEEPVVHEPPGERVDDEHGRDRAIRPAEDRRKTRLRRGRPSRQRRALLRFDAETAHHVARLLSTSVREQEPSRLGDVPVEQDQREPGRHTEEPHDPPAVRGDQPVGGPARDQEAECGAEARDEHDGGATLPRGDRFGEE